MAHSYGHPDAYAHEVIDGVEEGEAVVSGATFFIDSESQLRAAVSGMIAHEH